MSIANPALTPCRTPDELHAWIRRHLNLTIPRTPVCQGHGTPFEYLCRAYFEPSADQIVWAPRGGGKTSLAAIATLLDLLHKPGTAVRILGGSLEQSLRLWDHLLPHLETIDEASGDEKSKLIANPKSTSRKLKLTNGSTAAVLTQSQRSVRGLRVQKVRCDEVELFDPLVWEAAQLTTRSRGMHGNSHGPAVRGSIEALSTLHQPFGLMRTLVDGALESGRVLVKWCLLDVLEHCPPERECGSCPLWQDCRGVAKERANGFFKIDDAIAMKGRVSLDVWKSEIMCQKPSTRGLVYSNFDAEQHVRLDPPFDLRTAEWTLAMDFGFSAPFVCLWIAKAGEMVYVMDEYLQDQRTIDAHLTEIKRRPWPATTRVACDPAGNGRQDQTARSNIDCLRAAGFRVKSQPSSITDGIELVRAALRSASGQVRLQFHPRCKKLIAALQTYHYPNAQSELPEKDGISDHPLDALRYFYVNNQHQPIARRTY